MKIKDILRDERLSLSFEVFPPKNDTLKENVIKATEEIAALSPSYISVTYGAGGGTRKNTLDIAGSIQKKYGVPAMAHLTCVNASRESIASALSGMKKEGVENVLALRGDLPDGCSAPSCDFVHASDLVRAIKDYDGDFCIGAACYPEVHPESKNSKEDIKHLKEKVDMGVDFLTTQMFFDNTLFYSFLYRIREAGITVPVVPGIMPITKGIQVKRAIELSGCLMPVRFQAIVDRFGNEGEAMKEAGIAYTLYQIIDLYANGINHVHVYSMNSPEVAKKILLGLSGILGK